MIMVRIENLGCVYVNLGRNFPLDMIPVIVREGTNRALCNKACASGTNKYHRARRYFEP
jgi:hypothetical protein